MSRHNGAPVLTLLAVLNYGFFQVRVRTAAGQMATMLLMAVDGSRSPGCFGGRPNSLCSHLFIIIKWMEARRGEGRAASLNAVSRRSSFILPCLPVVPCVT